MNILKNTNKQSFFALDIGTTAVRVLQLEGGELPKRLKSYASVPIAPDTAASESEKSGQALQNAVLEAVKAANISEKQVVAGFASHRIFSAVADFPSLGQKELSKTISYQLDDYIPMPADEVKYDWSVLGPSPKNQDDVEVLITTINHEFAEKRLDLLESAGFDVIAFEPDPLGLARSLVSKDSSDPCFIVDIGHQATDLVATIGNVPRVIRSVPIGGQTFIKTVAQNLNLEEDQAREFVFKFGMTTDKVEGRVYNALKGTADSLVSEIQRSIKFFGDRYTQNQIQRIITSGRSSYLPNLPLYIANETGINVEIGNPWQNTLYSSSLHNDLMSLSAEYAVAVGLGLRLEGE